LPQFLNPRASDYRYCRLKRPHTRG
jgi:hypothetical protein